MSVAVLLAAQAAYDAAVVAGDWSAAVTALMRAKGALIGLPATELGEFRFEFKSAASIDSLIAECRRELQAAADLGGLQFMPITLTGETSLDEY